MRLAFVGILSNTIAIVGQRAATCRSGCRASRPPASPRRRPLAVPHDAAGPDAGRDFFLHAGPLGDILPIPLPLIQNVASIGDVFLTAGLAFFLFATVVRRHDDDAEEEPEEPDGPV